jgi:predicted amidohydrolase
MGVSIKRSHPPTSNTTISFLSIPLPVLVNCSNFNIQFMSALSISLIQTPLFWEDKAANLLMLEAKIAAIANKTNLVILPEMFSTGFSMRPQDLAEKMDGASVEWMKRMAKTNNIILTGSLIIEENKQYFNRLIWMLPTGNFGYYDKRHLFAFGGEHHQYTAGAKRLIASVNGWKLQLQICYDLRFPVWARQQSTKDPEYDVLVYVANWPEKRNHAWKSLLIARAIENQCYVIGVNRIGNDGNNVYHSGDSMIIDPLGNILFTNAHEAVTHTVELQKEALNEIRSHFPFWKDADQFHILQPDNHE